MIKIGVKRIMGEHAPKTGQKVVYSVVEWYPETPVMMRDVKQVTWELFKKRPNGEYTSTNIKKIGIGAFTFHEGAYGNEYMVEGYLKTPEKKGDTVIFITPQLGPPSLIKIELLDSNHKLLKKGTLHYGQTLLARVYCANMMGKTVKITLLEDDEPGAGHNEKNNRNVMDSQAVTVDKNGIAEATFLLSPAYIIKANKYGDGDKDKQHEYYVLAECENQQKASRNTNVDNPTYKPPVKTIPEIATEKVQNFLKEKLNVLRDILHDLPLPQTKNKAVVEETEKKKEDDAKVVATDIVTYHIYSDGRIEKHVPKKIKEEYKQKYKYVYHDKNGGEHNLGIGEHKTIENTHGSQYGGPTVDLIDIKQFPEYKKEDIKYKIMKWNTGTGKRYFLNDKTLAAFLGAILECSCEDIVFNGFSNSQGGAGVSQTHFNGFNGDIRYLCEDKSGSNLHLDIASKSDGIYGWKDMDKERQIKLIEALYRFGWKKFYSWKFNNGELLPHCTQLVHHNHHLHMYSFTPNFKEVYEP